MRTLTFKVSEEEDRTIRAQARLAKLSLSEYLRRKLRSHGKPATRVKVARSKLTGAPVFVGTAEMAPLTVDSVREMLADFP